MVPRRIIVLIWTLSLISLTAHAAGKGQCTDGDFPVCVGEVTYGYSDDVYHGKVTGIESDGSIDFKTDSGQALQLSTDNIAIVAAGTCLDKICVGKTATMGLEGVGQMTAHVQGVFPTGYAVVSSDDHNLYSVKSSDLQDQSPMDQESSPYERALMKFLEVQESVASVGPKGRPCNSEAFNNPYLVHMGRNTGGDAVELDKYLHTWRTADAKPRAGNPWPKKCSDPKLWGEPVASDGSGFLRPECAPDTLYSWGPAQKITDFEQIIGSGDWKSGKFDREIYTVGTPTGSFAYGNYAMRIKVKPGVKFKVVRADINDDSWNVATCDNLKPEELKNTIVVRVFNNNSTVGLEYDICSSGPIQSWSFGTRHHYDEMVKDVKYIENSKNADYQTYLQSLDDKPQPLYWDEQVDGFTYSQDNLRENLRGALDLAEGGAGKVFVNPDSRTKDPAADLARHFQSKMKSYFHDE